MAALGHTQASLAAECGVDVRTVQRWLAGQTVSLSRAEQVARALRVGTSVVFEDVPEPGLSAFMRRMGFLQRLLSGRDGVLASGFRTTTRYFSSALVSVVHSAHPVHGFVSIREATDWTRNAFCCVRIRCTARDAEIGIRYQLNDRLAIVHAGVWLTADSAFLVETFQLRSMAAEREADGSVRLWLWVTESLRDLVIVANAEVELESCESTALQQLDVDADLGPAALCIRPSPVDMRNAGLPMGFDRLTGTREGRVDVAVNRDPATLRAG